MQHLSRRRQRQPRRRQRGSSVLESLVCILLLLFVFGSFLQLFQWIARQMIMDYASLNGAKALALGYAGENSRKTVRLAAAGASGRDLSGGGDRVSVYSNSRERLRRQAVRYMTMGEGSGVRYQHWQDGSLAFSFQVDEDRVSCRPRLKAEPLFPAMNAILSLRANGEPALTGSAEMYNYAALWLDE